MPIVDSNATNVNDEALVSDVLSGGNGLQSELTVGVAAVEGKVGGLPLANRKYIIFMALDSGVYMGASNSVTTSTGVPIFKNQLIMMPKESSIWFIATGAGKLVRFIEED